MRAFLIFLVFVVVLAVAVVAYTPLGFVLNRSGVGSAGIGWAKVDGSLVRGRVTGLYVGNQPVGDVNLKLEPISLLSMKPRYQIQWGGAGGRGTAALTLSRSELVATDIRAQHEIASLEGLAPEVRAMGGSLRVRDGAFVLSPSGCISAEGTLSSDILTEFAVQYGRQFGELSGPLSCLAGAFEIAMRGQSDTGDTVSFDARSVLNGESSFQATVNTSDVQIILALTQVGFTREDRAFVYRGSN